MKPFVRQYNTRLGGVMHILRPHYWRAKASEYDPLSATGNAGLLGICIRKFITVAFGVLFTLGCYAGTSQSRSDRVTIAADRKVAADSVKVFFRVGKSIYQPSFSGNGKTLEGFLEAVRAANDRDGIEKIVVTGYASPEGGDELNDRLSRQRAQVVADIIREKADIKRNLIQTVAPGVNWQELRDLVAQREDVPDRQAVLDILDNTPIWIFNSKGNIIGGRKKRLMDLKGGRPYRWMLRYLFPQLRSSVAVMLYYKEEEAVPVDTVLVPEIIDIDTVSVTEVIDTIFPSDAEAQPEQAVRYEYGKRQDWALKTNLLYDAALMPNLEVEWRFADKWSALVSGNVAWWAKEPRHKVYRLGFGTAEVRYWLPGKERWKGWYVGAMIGGGLYDLDAGPKHNGYKGEGGFAGLSGGYMWPLGKHWLIETGLGVGYMYTRYKEYTQMDGHFPYMRTKEMNYFGPISLKVSLGYRFDRIINKREVRP